MNARGTSGAIALLVADLLSVAGNAIVGVAVPWLVLARTGDAALAGLVAAAAAAPLVVAAFLGGAIIDRLGPRRVSIIADTLSSLAVVAIPIADLAGVLSIPLLAVLVALGAVFDGPGMGAKESLAFAVARASGIPLAKLTSYREALQGAGMLAGPGLGGILIFAFGAPGALWAAAALFVLAVLLMSTLVPRADGDRGHSVAAGYWSAVRSGVVHLWRDRTLRAVALIGAVLFFFLAPLESVALTTYFAREGDPRDLGVVLASLGVGAIAGSLAYGALAKRLRRRPLLIGSLVLTGVLIALLALLPPVPVMALVAGLIGFVSGPINPLGSVITQERTTDQLRGRTISTLNSLALAAAPAGLVLAGVVVEGGGVAIALLGIGVGCAIAGVATALSPALRTLDDPLPPS